MHQWWVRSHKTTADRKAVTTDQSADKIPEISFGTTITIQNRNRRIKKMVKKIKELEKEQ